MGKTKKGHHDYH